MERWCFGFERLGSIRLHHWFRSDDKRFKHDHPSDFITLVLKGSYTDIASIPETCGVCGGEPDRYAPCACNGTGTVWREVNERMTPGKLRRRRAEHRHTAAVDPGGCWTLCFFFPDRRDWGFWVPRKLDGILKFKKANKFFYEHGHHPCDQP